MDNFSARVMRMWGMDYASLAKIKPDIISISMSGLAYRAAINYVSYGPTLHALAGFTRLMADARGEPAGYGYSYADMAGGYSGALAALIALWHRNAPAAASSSISRNSRRWRAWPGRRCSISRSTAATQEPPGWRSQEAPAAPHGVYRCRPRGDDDDRWIVIAVRSQAEWERFARAIGNPRMDRDRNSARSTSGCAIARNSTRMSRDGPRRKTPRPRWRCCKARESPPVSRSTAPTSPPIRSLPSAVFSRRSNFPMTVPPA